MSETAIAPLLTFPFNCLQIPLTNWWGSTNMSMSAPSAESFTSGIATYNEMFL